MTLRKLERLRHIRYFTNCLQNLPQQYSTADTTRLTLVHFCVQALDILGCLPDVNCCGDIEQNEVYIYREEIVEWIYGLQTLPTAIRKSSPSDECLDEGNGSSSSSVRYVGGGFKGGTYLGPLPNASDESKNDEKEWEQKQQQQQQHPYDHSHLAMTYVALCTLVTLGDDLSRVHKKAILQTLQSLQKEDGSFEAISSNYCNGRATNPLTSDKEEDDCDLRFMYLAITVWYLLTDPTNNNDKSSADNNENYPGINIKSATSYILSCISYDGSIGLTPGREGHGGSAFCGIASLHLMGVLDDVLATRDKLAPWWKADLIRWCVMRQYSLPKQNADNHHDDKKQNGYFIDDNSAGMQGRPNKLQDTCYSYWIGGTLHLLNESHLLDGWALREYVLTCQSPYGGFGKVVGAMPDVLHSFYSLAWLAMSKQQGCCEEEENEDEDVEVLSSENGERFGYDIETREQVYHSIQRLSELDCALGICAKRKIAFQKAAAMQYNG
mmetsp:Transcript_32181/g.68096  ORF Transcript_32181/g.68096 Transcript_32181/m.68096 type:complete len:496 (+) Transcript_32181:31-1518(+)